ncbi:MAG: GNAT family N-acetyltransferase [Chloroflexota bacterium]|nr:GNAT family N-acetyltransferase [Chloroflexota bacterium]
MSAPRHTSLIPVPAEICSARLLLRPLREADAGQVLAAIEESREHLAPWLSWPPTIQHLDDARELCIRWAARWTLRTDLGLGMFSLDDGRFLGATGMHDPNWALRSFEIGYWLRTSAVGAGYVTEAVQLQTVLACEVLEARRVEIRCDPLNLQSRRVPERLGFALEGHLRNAWLDPLGNVRDTLVFAATPQDYPCLKEAWRATAEWIRPQAAGSSAADQGTLRVTFAARA